MKKTKKILPALALTAVLLPLASCNSLQVNEETLEQTFAKYDSNNDGVISKDELIKIETDTEALASESYGERKKRATEQADQFFKDFDSNKDGKISLKEWLADQ